MPSRDELDAHLQDVLSRYPNVPYDVARRLIGVESSGDASAVSPKGARGVMQLMPGTARDMGVADPMDWRQNVEGGVKYLSQNINQFGLPAGIAAYQTGPGNVRRDLARGGNGIPDNTDGITRTPDYVRRVMGDAQDAPAAQPAAARSTRSVLPQYADSHAFNPVSVSPPPPKKGVFSELANELWSGIVAPGEDLKEAVHQTLGPDVVDAIENVGDALGMPRVDKMRADVTANTSADMQDAQQAKWWTDDGPGPAFTNWRSYASGLLQSMPETLLSVVPAMRAGSLAGRMAATAAARTAAERGLSKEAAEALIEKAASRAQNGAAFLVGNQLESVESGAQSARQVRDEIMHMDDATLDKSDAFKQLVAYYKGDRALAKRRLAEDQSAQGMVLGYLATVPFSGFGDVALARAFRGQLEGGLAKRLGKTIASEGGEEFAQGFTQQVGQNVAEQAADPDKGTYDDALNQAVGGGVIGSLQGAGPAMLPGRRVAAAPDTAPPLPTPPPAEAPRSSKADEFAAKQREVVAAMDEAQRADVQRAATQMVDEDKKRAADKAAAARDYERVTNPNAQSDEEAPPPAPRHPAMVDGDIGRPRDGQPYAARLPALSRMKGEDLADTHEVVQLGPKEFVIRPKAEEQRDAVSQPGAGEVLQREPAEAGAAGGERERVESGEQGPEPAAASEPVADATPAASPRSSGARRHAA
jgi:hypothetical protein